MYTPMTMACVYRCSSTSQTFLNCEKSHLNNDEYTFSFLSFLFLLLIFYFYCKYTKMKNTCRVNGATKLRYSLFMHKKKDGEGKQSEKTKCIPNKNTTFILISFFFTLRIQKQHYEHKNIDCSFLVLSHFSLLFYLVLQ